jgi:hypothetical protein
MQHFRWLILKPLDTIYESVGLVENKNNIFNINIPSIENLKKVKTEVSYNYKKYHE